MPPVAVNTTVLSNGVRILSQQMPHVRSVSMGVWVNVGARDESARENGLSHFIEHMIFKGTERRNGLQIAKEFDAIGGHTNAFTAMENTCYHAKVVDNHMETMVDILADIFLNSVFDAGEVEKERPVILQEIGMSEDIPDEYVHMLQSRNFWGDNPLGRSILGTRQNVSSFGVDAIRDFFCRLYQPERIVISVAGNLEHRRFVDLMGPAFESITSGHHFPERVTPRGHALVDLHRRDLEQAHICLGTRGLPVTDPRRYALSLLNTLLGGNMSSRLFQEIRERRGLAYSVYSFVSSHIDTGMFGVYMGTDPQRALESTELVLKTMREFKTCLVGAAELHNAKEFSKGSLLLASESIDNQMVRLAQNEIHLGYHLSLENVIAAIEAVSADDILELSNDLFQNRELTLTLLGSIENKSAFENIRTF